MSISRRNLLAVTATGIVAAAIDVGGSRADAGGLRASTGVGALTGAIRGQVATTPTSVALGTTSWDQTIQRNSYTAPGYQLLKFGNGEPHVVRTDLCVDQNPPTVALAAFAQMTDLHIVDDQSPGRIEFMDRYADAGAPHFASYPTDSAYRPHEFLSTQVVDAMCQAIAGIAKGPWTGTPLQFTIVTGDAVDNCQHNENRWYIDLLDGGQTIVPNSGRSDLDQSIPSGNVISPATDNGYYYPSYGSLSGNEFTGNNGLGFPIVPGLLKVSTGTSAARRPFVSHGLGTPWYAAYGNHDGMWQGNQPLDSNLLDTKPFTVSSNKIVGTTVILPDLYPDLSSFREYEGLTNPSTVPVAPDPNRRMLSRKAFVEDHFNTAGLPVGHGFQGVGIDKAYYAIPFASTDLIRYITLDSTNTLTNGEGSGDAGGSLDDTQYEWLKQELIANSRTYIDDNGRSFTRTGVTDMMYVLFCHHTLRTMNNLDDGTILGDGDKRWSGDEVEALLLRFPNVIAMVNGHTHANKIIPHQAPAGSPLKSAFWEISTASHIDWPIQSRIIEIAASPDARNRGEFGNAVGPGTISIFTTMVDPAAPRPSAATSATPPNSPRWPGSWRRTTRRR